MTKERLILKAKLDNAANEEEKREIILQDSLQKVDRLKVLLRLIELDFRNDLLVGKETDTKRLINRSTGIYEALRKNYCSINMSVLADIQAEIQKRKDAKERKDGQIN